MASPRGGRLFLRSHGDCFIHSTASFVKYWNFSLSQGGLGIVKVTITEPHERVFLACMSPKPIPYENVQPGIHQRKYLEIDPKFAAELEISHETEVVLESVKSIEKCLKLSLAPKTSDDYELLYQNIEKINFELAEQIRVVSCQQFFTFPVWINQNTVSVKIVSSEPSANWVMIVPDETMVYLSRGDLASEGDDSTGLTTATTVTTNTTTPDVMDEEEGEGERDDHSSAFMNVSSLTHQYPNPNSNPNQGRSKSSASAESSVDMDNSYDNWGLHSFIQGVSRRFFDIAGSKENSAGVQETSVESSDVISTEPKYDGDKLYTRNQIGYSRLSGSATVQGHGNAELTAFCVRGSNLTPEPVLVSPRGDSKDSKHKRTATWHSETQFSPRKDRSSLHSSHHSSRSKLPVYVSTPRISATLRVQPHSIGKVKVHSMFTPPELSLSSSSDVGYWPHERLFDVFVHPSTLPEMYHLSEREDHCHSFLVQLLPLVQPHKYVVKSADSAIRNNGDLNDSVHGGSGSSNSASEDIGLPSSLVVRLCFASWISVGGGEMTTGTSLRGVPEGGEGEVVLMQTGQVVMSDAVRRQLKIRECSKVKLFHVKDSWKMSFVDAIKVGLHPLKYNKKDKSLLTNFRDWLKMVSEASTFGSALVNNQILPLRDSEGDWVDCQLKITSGKLVSSSIMIAVSYLLLNHSDFDRKRFVAMMVDSATSRAPFPLKRSPQYSSESRSEESVKIPDMADLNQHVITATPEDFGAFTDVLNEATVYLQTVFFGQRRCGTLLVCGLSGTAGAGCGKTGLVNLIAGVALKHPYYAFVRIHDCTNLRGQTTTRTKKRLLSIFSEAVHHQPSVLILEDLDQAMPSISDAQEQVQEEGISSNNRTQVFKDLLHGLMGAEARVLIIATAQNKQQLNKALLTSQGTYTFDRVLEIQPPTLVDRKEIIAAILSKKKLPSLTDSDLRAVAAVTEGYQAGDLTTLVDRAVSHSELRVLCPSHSPPYNPSQDSLYKRMSMESASDLDLSLEYSTSPQKAGPMSHFTNTFHKNSGSLEFDSGISSPTSPINCPRTKKISEASASALTPSALTPVTLRSFDQSSLRISRAGSLSQMILTVADFLTALDGFVPVSLRGLPLHKFGTVDFAHVGGLESTKQKLRETLLWPSKYPKLFSQCTIKQRRGILLYGAPGTGKTMLSGAVAKEFGLNFVSVKGPELLSKYIGASEKAVRDIFARAQSARPCILFFDEFDSLAPRRGHDNTGVTDRVVNQLLTQLDGVEGLHGVYVLAASSRPDLIDPALLRPGRLDIRLCCNIPDENERYEIFRTHSKEVKMNVDVNLRELAKPSYTEHFTGADIKALLYNAQLEAVHTMLEERRKTSLESNSQISLSMNSESRNSESSLESLHDSAMTFTYSESGLERNSTLSKDTETKIAHLNFRKRKDTLVPSNDSLGGVDHLHSSSTVKPSVILTQELLIKAAREMRPSVSERERMKYSRIYEKFTGKSEKETIQDIKPIVTLA